MTWTLTRLRAAIRGGPIDDLWNLIPTCDACHRFNFGDHIYTIDQPSVLMSLSDPVPPPNGRLNIKGDTQFRQLIQAKIGQLQKDFPAVPDSTLPLPHALAHLYSGDDMKERERLHKAFSKYGILIIPLLYCR
jgi:hypothetical protein